MATLEPDQLDAARLQRSRTNVESLTYTIARGNLSAAELLLARVSRVCYTDPTRDTEWRNSDDQQQSGLNDQGQLAVSAQAMLLDLARAPYVVFDGATGRPSFDFSGTQLTATQWLTNAVLPCIAEAAYLYPVTIGTVEFANLFDLTGSFANALEIIRGMQQPGNAPGDFVYRRNGATDYKLDLLLRRGSGASTVRVQTAKNLLANVRKRTLSSLGTKIMPMGAQASAVRDLSATWWPVKTVVSGTVATLEDPYGGAGPIAFTDQLKNLWTAPIASTFASQQITASDPATQNITVASTAGWVAGTTKLRFFRTSGSAGQRVISLAHPTRVLSPANGGYGPVTRILDMPTSVGDANLLDNAWLNTWTTPTNAPDGYTRSTTFGTWSRETSVFAQGTYSEKIDTGLAGGAQVLTRSYGPSAAPFTTSGLRYCASRWVKFDSVSAATAKYVRVRVMKPDLSISYADGDYYDPVQNIGEPIKVTVQNVDLSTATAGVVVVIEVSVTAQVGANAAFVAHFGPSTLSESDIPISDVLYNGGISMWQRSNTLLPVISTPIAGYTIQLADLERMDGSAWSDEPLDIGVPIEVMDTDLNDVTTQTVEDLDQNLLDATDATVQLQTTDPLATTALAGSVTGSSISGAVSGGNGTAVAGNKPTTLADYGITDGVTQAQLAAALAKFQFVRAGALWVIRTTPAVQTWASVCYGAGLFVAVASAAGGGDQIMTSPDGVTWTTRVAPAVKGWFDVCYANGQFVAIATNFSTTVNAVMTSPDGITWTAHNSAIARGWTSICYGAGLYVAVADTGVGNRVMTSPDGITWTARVSAADSNWTRVVFGNGLFVAVATSGTVGQMVMTSPDGITWTLQASATNDAWWGLAYGNGLFVAVSLGTFAGAGGTVMTSADGVTWLENTAVNPSQWRAICFGNGMFVAVAAAGTSGCHAMTSTDGRVWRLQPSAPDGTWCGVTAGPGLFVAVAQDINSHCAMTTTSDQS